MLTKIKLLLGISDTSKDNLLNLLIELATDDITDLIHRGPKYSGELDNLIISAVLYNYNLLGAEGLSGESYSGASFTYSTDYPEALTKRIKALRKVVVV